MMRVARIAVYVSLAAATVLILHGLADVSSYISLQQYAAGTERMPFQGRMLMTFPIRLAERSVALQRWTHGREGLDSPESAVVIAIGLLSVLAAGVLITLLYRKISTRQDLPYLPYIVILGTCTFSYRLGYFTFPYDLPSLAFFTGGVYLVFSRRFWTLVLLFPIATLNRETTLFLIPMMVLDAMWDESGRRVKGWLRLALVGRVALLSVIWVGVAAYVRYRFRYNVTEMGWHVRFNLGLLSRPLLWPNVLSACCFLLPVVLVYQRRIANQRFRAYVWIIPMWLVFMFLYGSVIETRIYGELSGLVGLAATLILEESIGARRDRIAGPVASST